MLAACLVAVAPTARATAQTVRALTGTVIDQSGGAVAAALVTVSAQDGATVATATTDPQGTFRIEVADAGALTVRVEAGLFEPASVDVRPGTGGEPARLTIVLRVAGLTETVGVRVSIDRLQVAQDESSSRVRLLERRDLDVLPVRDPFGALVTMPNVDMRQSGSPIGEGSITMYGVSGQPLAPTSNVIALNGVPLNTGLLPETSLNLVPFILVERFELVQGPGSSAYGSNATTGVLNMTTRRQTRPVEAAVELSVASRWNTRDTAGWAGGGQGRSYNWLVGGSWRDTDGHLQPAGRTDYSDARKQNVAALAERQVGSARLSAGVVRFESDEHNPDVRTPNRAQRLETTRLHANAAAAWTPSAATALDVTFVHNASQGRSRETFDTRVIGFGLSASRPSDPSDQRAHSNGVIGRAHWTTARNLLMAGAEVHDAEVTDNLTMRQNSGHTTGVFVQNRYLAVDGQLSISAGFRYDKASTYDEASSSPKVGVVWKPTGGRWLVRGNVSRAFNAPTFSQLFSTGFVRGNPGLVAQTLLLGEVGAEVRPSAFLNLGVSVFRLSLDNPIFPRFNAAINATQFTNVSVASDNAGGMVTADYRRAGWLAGASYTYLDPGQATFHTWRHTGKVFAAWTAGRVSLGAELRGQTEGYWADGFARPADDYAVINARISYAPLARLTLTATAENLGNARYATSANIGNVAGVSNNTGIPRPGRFFAVGLRAAL